MATTEADSEYLLGGSSEELDRINGIHESTVDHMGKLLLAPVDFGSSRLRILDSGTAGGRWLKDLRAEKGEDHEYIGTDITVAFLPPSLKDNGIVYGNWDITKPWPEALPSGFDLVHQRFVLGGVAKQALKEAVTNLTSLVKPGGWIELLESDVREAVGAADEENNGAAPVWKLLRDVYLAMQVEPDVDRYLPGWLEEAGFVEITEEGFVIPVGAKKMTASEMGPRSARTVAVTAQHLAMGAKRLPPGSTSFSLQELDALPGRVDEALRKCGGTYSVYTICARKPTTA